MNYDVNEKNIIVLIGKAIREGKYLSIAYKNKDSEITSFWISIHDINANGELWVNTFNVTKDKPLLDIKIHISGILKAEILMFSEYNVSEDLIRRIDEDVSLEKYQFDRFDNNILNYYLECYKSNQDPFLHRQHLIPSIDLDELLNKNPYQLSEQQQKNIIKEIYHNHYEKFYDYELAFCEFSIDLESKGKFVVAFRKMTFDPVAKTLHIKDKIYYNPNFYIDKLKYSLSYYIDLSPADFEMEFEKDKMGTIARLTENFKYGELPNTRPEIVVLGYSQIYNPQIQKSEFLKRKVFLFSVYV